MSARPVTIHRQVLTFAFAICAFVLLAIGGVLFFHHLQQTRDRLSQSLQSIARIVAAQSSAAVAFSDAAACGEMLRSLRYDPLIRYAVFYDKQGLPIATYGTPSKLNQLDPALDPVAALRVPIGDGNEIFGTLLVITDNRGELRRTALTWIAVYGSAFVVASLIALVLASRFRRAVADPIVSLARTARYVTSNSDYSPRVIARGSAEVVALAESFNTMLEELGRRDEALASQLVALNREIQERKDAQDTLRENTREMLRLSREAGMAEVATGVLHNIGNALNSINVSAEILVDRLGNRACAALVSLRDLFRSPTEKAAAVFGAHPAGTELQNFALTYSEHAVAQLSIANTELGSLRVGVGHLKDIVARQQSLAKAPRFNESFDLFDAMREALLIDKTTTHASLPGLRVETVEDSPPPHLVHADRSAVVQVLINLLANARAALSGAVTPAPRITLRIHPAGERLALSVIDNGIGIPPAQIISIFSYGFTTKSAGHGFGLHNAANTARLLGGSLHVHSAGTGHGATFTLELPRLPSVPHDA
jgi:C4-dicarboxylate-specific signal transduction histidine kinase